MVIGSPQVTRVWVDYKGEHIFINSIKGCVKDRNMHARPQVALNIVDPQNPYRDVTTTGRVVEITEQGARDHIDKLVKKYMGLERYTLDQPSDVRRIYKIQVGRVTSAG
jgi:PPOX class probable F420-dependent enzyme